MFNFEERNICKLCFLAVPRQKSARIAKIREKEEQERRELEAIRLKQLAEENRLREIKKKAREERRVRLT